MTAYLCLGANLGHPRSQINRALRLIDSQPGISVARESSVILTKPYGKTDQPDFWNQAVQIETDLLPHELLRRLLDLEQQLGRVRGEKWGPRAIDIDILLYGDEIVNERELSLPHPDFHNRRFALELLCELDRGIRHPVFGKNVLQLLEELKESKENQ